LNKADNSDESDSIVKINDEKFIEKNLFEDRLSEENQ
jgi:hypothetical protein